MKTPYVFNDFCYVLSNFGVASNPIFLQKEDAKNFKRRIEKHLSSLCEILSFNFTNHEFQLVVSLKDREAFEGFYLKKHKKKQLAIEDIPESTYILSQEMANIQSGYAKHFNYKYERKGAVFARRFSKNLITSEEELDYWVNRCNAGQEIEKYDWKWSYRIGNMHGFGKLKKFFVSSMNLYLQKLRDTQLSTFILFDDFIFQGKFSAPRIVV